MRNFEMVYRNTPIPKYSISIVNLEWNSKPWFIIHVIDLAMLKIS